MSEENGFGIDMKQLNLVTMANNTSTASLWKSLGGYNLPAVVGIIVVVPRYLLTCVRSEG